MRTARHNAGLDGFPGLARDLRCRLLRLLRVELGFQPGTIFRFPLRTLQQASVSEIWKEPFSENSSGTKEIVAESKAARLPNPERLRALALGNFDNGRDERDGRRHGMRVRSIQNVHVYL